MPFFTVKMFLTWINFSHTSKMVALAMAWKFLGQMSARSSYKRILLQARNVVPRGFICSKLLHLFVYKD